MKKRLLSLLLALTLCLALLPGMAAAEGETITEQFDLTPGGTYYFDLSGVDIPGTVNDGAANGTAKKTAPLPDLTLHYAPFTYTGTIDAYVLNSSSAGESASSDAASKANSASTDTEKQYGYTYEHSLFIADFNVSCGVSWDSLHAANLIFGRAYINNGVRYTMRAPTEGNVMFNPSNNEWSLILSKSANYIKNWENRWSWGQDTDGYPNNISDLRRAAGGDAANERQSVNLKADSTRSSYRPVLELPLNLDRTALKPVALNLNGGHVGTDSDRNNISIIVKNGESFTAPTAEGLTRPDGNADSYFKWLGSDGKVYAPGDSVPASVTSLTALWQQYTLTFDTDGGSEVAPITQDYNTQINAPEAPTKYGYTFAGWYDGENKQEFPFTLTGNKALKAKWTINQYTVTFDSAGDSNVASITQDYNTPVDAPEAPTKYGYTFAGWYDGENKQEFPFTLTGDKTLKAKWTPIPVTPAEEPTTPWWTVLPALDQTADFSFDDVNRRDWFYNDVYSAYEAGFMTGTSADTFSPYSSATRGMIVTVLARMSGVSTAGTPWYAAGQRWAMTNGISDGTSMTGSITREQLVAMLYRYAQLCGADVSVGADTNILSYSDAFDVSEYAVPAMQWACGVGLVQGAGGKLSPKALANRAQVAALLMRFCTLVR